MKLSVIVPLFNGRRFIRDTIKSLLNDSVSPSEVIVVDDGSSDASFEMFSDLPVSYIKNDRNLGIAGALNSGLKVAQGKYISFLDQDDLLSPGGNSWRVRWLDDHPHAGVIAGHCAGFVDLFGKPANRSPKPFDSQRLTLQDAKNGSSLFLQSLMFRRSLLEEVGLFSTELIVVVDREYLFRIAERQEVPVESQPVFIKRIHPQNFSSIQARRLNAELALLMVERGNPL